MAIVLTACGGAPAPTLTQPPDTTAIIAQGTAFTTANVTVPAMTPGTYRFTCDIHPGMAGELVAN